MQFEAVTDSRDPTVSDGHIRAAPRVSAAIDYAGVAEEEVNRHGARRLRWPECDNHQDWGEI